MKPAMEGGRVGELESKIAALSKDNSRLKNELKFTKETERYAGFVRYQYQSTISFFLCNCRRAAAEQINSLRRTLDMLQAKNEQVFLLLVPSASYLSKIAI